MRFLLKISLLVACCLVSVAEAKVNIYAHYFGQPEFIKYQYLFFKKNMLNDYEFYVFEDSHNPAVSAEIKSECEKYGIKYIRIENEVFDNPKLPIASDYVSPHCPSFECAVATQYIFDNYVVPSKDICLILDNDIFLISPFDLEKYLGSKAFAYQEETRANETACVNYMLPNFVIFNPRLMPAKERLNFNLGTILGNNTDSGGYTYFYLKDYASLGKPLLKYYLAQTPSPLKERYLTLCPLLFTSEEWGSHCFIEKDLFLHIRMGSNWSLHPNYAQIRRDVATLFDTLLKQ